MFKAFQLANCRLVDLFQDALKQCVGSIDTEYSKKHDEFFIGFEGR